jgi:hypothetical protein
VDVNTCLLERTFDGKMDTCVRRETISTRQSNEIKRCWIAPNISARYKVIIFILVLVRVWTRNKRNVVDVTNWSVQSDHLSVEPHRKGNR